MPHNIRLPISSMIYLLFILTAPLRLDQLQFLTPHSGHALLWNFASLKTVSFPMSLDFRFSLVTDLHQYDER